MITPTTILLALSAALVLASIWAFFMAVGPEPQHRLPIWPGLVFSVLAVALAGATVFT